MTTSEGQLVYVAGPGRTGSTLFDLLLNRHPAVQSVGEVHRLCAYARTDRPCTCGELVPRCPFWLSVERCFPDAPAGFEPGSLLRTRELMFEPEAVGRVQGMAQKAMLVGGPRWLYQAVAPALVPAHVEATRNSFLWYEAIRRATGKPIVVDSTKDARRLKILYFAHPERFLVVQMVRDGRAVAAATMRREGADMDWAARRWAREQRFCLWASRGIPSAKVTRVRYEDLCRDTRGEMERVCAFLGVPFDERVLELDKGVAHDIGGNPMRFRKDEQAIALDERWRTELSPADVATFERIAGRLNRSLGYSD